MAGSVRLVLAFHNHQPIGNFPGVFEQAYQESYLPFLDVWERCSELPFALHTSGSLLEWIEEAHPEYIERVRALTAKGNVEIIGGAYYEPILSNIPRRDRIGQIRMYTDHLQTLFATDVRGMWVPERVWEQTFAGDLSHAGIEYTILDDFHFRSTGLKKDQLHGYYVTEDEGRLLAVFPGSEKLRYTIPFQDPQKTVDYLRGIADRFDDAVVVFGDDGEKFGTWPDTFKHVYEDRWLERFLDALRENSDWLNVVTPSAALGGVEPLGRIYLADASYREMTEWVLPPRVQQDLVRLTHDPSEDPEFARLQSFARGGFWRNFRVRYPESNEMYCRMMEVSARIDELTASGLDDEEHTEKLEDARRLLYQAQCNCSYWHGAFGGLYLPHLRNAVYDRLIQADTIIESITRTDDSWVDSHTGDYNLDARPDVRLSSHRMVAYFNPADGGHMYELDIRQCRTNLLATLNRRPEAYHDKVCAHAARLKESAETGIPIEAEEVESIHDLIRFKQPGLEKKLTYDDRPRKSLTDLFLHPHLSLDAFRRNEGIIGTSAGTPFEAVIHTAPHQRELELTGHVVAGDFRIRVRRIVTMSASRAGELLIRVELSDLPPAVPLHYGLEFAFATMPGGASDRYFYGDDGTQLGTLDQSATVRDVQRIGLVDEWQGLDVSLESDVRGEMFLFPIETISQSEAGFEAIHQSVMVVPHWEFVASEDGTWVVELRLLVDTAAARAKQLSAIAEQRRRFHEGHDAGSSSSVPQASGDRSPAPAP